ncbi:family 28 glycosyl hydrolase [Colletotrichum navitas]|uniref:endo-polygalacturonase n=1 Tax=Colletotrichum navitas TaxID=681940 RepID=A0AAD8PRH5_9PEZI|nr:family 28 glycosyl hydrolase [Colletotrichum navitas]KAK1579325.1 family 28 glycosyl hydrolase [Colletotrichum navitas]
MKFLLMTSGLGALAAAAVFPGHLRPDMMPKLANTTAPGLNLTIPVPSNTTKPPSKATNPPSEVTSPPSEVTSPPSEATSPPISLPGNQANCTCADPGAAPPNNGTVGQPDTDGGEQQLPGGGVGAGPGACVITDFESVKAQKASCTDMVLKGVAVPGGRTLDLTGLQAGTRVTFADTTTFGYKEWDGPLVSVSGDGVSVVGAPGHVIDCDGDRWWDGKGVKMAKKDKKRKGSVKPRFFTVAISNGSVSRLNVLNTPARGFNINGASNLEVRDILFDNRDGECGGGKNTDAFHIGESTDVTIARARVYNQDDCLTITSGARILFRDGYCRGSHGLAVGSVGGRDVNNVTDVMIRDSVLEKGVNGIRIKAEHKKQGSIAGVTFQNIVFKNVKKQGIVVQQDYKEGKKPTGKPTDGIPITGVTITNVTGTVAEKGTNVLILCAEGACADWAWSGVDVSGGKTSKKCKNIPDNSGAAC